MSIEHSFSYLKSYIEKHLDDDCGNWEYVHSPHITSVIGSMNAEQSKEFSREIWALPEQYKYELADPIIFSDNKFIDQHHLYCRIFSELRDFEHLEYLVQNLAACYNGQNPNDLSIEQLLRISLNLTRELRTEGHPDLQKQYSDLLLTIEEHLETRK